MIPHLNGHHLCVHAVFVLERALLQRGLEFIMVKMYKTVVIIVRVWGVVAQSSVRSIGVSLYIMYMTIRMNTLPNQYIDTLHVSTVRER